ncbi:MAG TPA: hypothetical protein VEK57_14515 [Thermoanaerobaculia bacterium]|nr:hypothetical protein [Thermoanaerobaculia bacterium]
MRRTVTGFLVLLFLAMAMLVSGKPAFSGTYSITGTNPGVGPYKGTLTITPRGEVFDVAWNIAGLQYVGVGVVQNETLAVTYSGATDRSWSGVIAYRQKTDGVLEGRWRCSAARAGRGPRPRHGSSPVVTGRNASIAS